MKKLLAPIILAVFALAGWFLLSGCSATTSGKIKSTAAYAASRLGPKLAQIVITSAIQTITDGQRADFLDSAAAGLRTLPLEVNDEDIRKVVDIWTTPRGLPQPPPELRPANALVAKIAAKNPETAAVALNVAADIVRNSSVTP